MRARRRFSVLIATVGASLSLAAAAYATVTTETASSGDVSATLTFSGTTPNVADMRLQIVRSGQRLYDQAVSSRACGERCDPGAFGSHASSVRVLDIEGDREPDVIVELYSGGANCCFIDQVFSFDPGTTTYVKTEHNFAYAGAALRMLGPSLRFVSADGRFECAFTDCADSGQPIQIWSFATRRFHDLTRQYPKLIASDAARWLRLFNRHLRNGVGLIAAWAADEELLDNNGLVQSKLTAEAGKGNLRDGSLGQATGRRFIAKLNRLLRTLGYERG